jgi:hypothetical protein
MSFKRDNTKVRTSFSAGPIKIPGFYSCTIVKCYDRKSQVPDSESAAIHFDIIAGNGQYSSFDLWWKGKDGTSETKNGNPLPALEQINDIQILLNIDELKSKSSTVKIYDYDLKMDVDTKKMVYQDLINQQIGIVFDVSMQPKNINVDGKWIPSNEMKSVVEFKQFFDAETKQSAGEYLEDSDPIACDRLLTYLEQDENIIKQANNQPNKPIVDAIKTSTQDDNFDDDMPF